MQIKQFTQHLLENGKDDSWSNLANKYKLCPTGTIKQKSDFARRLAKKIFNVDKITESINTGYVHEVDFYIKNVNVKKRNDNNYLLIPDIHIPFEHHEALAFLKYQQDKWDCGKVIFMGDIVDFNAFSFHEKYRDGMSGMEEFSLSLDKLQDWYKAFPEAICLMGNHDNRIMRKANAAGLLTHFMKPLKEILNTPDTWNFTNEYFDEKYEILFTHGEGGTASTKMKSEFVSVVQGHLHTESYIRFERGITGQYFGMQVGTLIDDKSYAFDYAKKGKKSILTCGVIIDGNPILIPLV